MKSLFEENRAVVILQYLHNHTAVRIGALAAKLSVSERTVRNDIKQLNRDLASCAAIEGEKGRYDLRIFDMDRFNELYSSLTKTDEFMNSGRNRMNYIFASLMRSDEAILTDELAYEMNIGRTTIVSDLKKLREEIREYNLSILGKTSKGLTLEGEELDIRTYVMETMFEDVYRDYPLDKEIQDIIRHTLKAHSFEKNVRENYVRFVTLMLDRLLTGHGLGKLSAKYYNLTMRSSFEVVDTLLDQLGLILHTDIPIEEKIYTFLPIAGMRTPGDINELQMISLDDSIRPLIQKVFYRIRQELNIKIVTDRFEDEFLYHMMFMLNRIRFHVKIENPLYEELITKYPLAYQMAVIASMVISEEYGFTVPDSEKGYLTAYFGIFLSENGIEEEKPFRIAVVCEGGKVTAQLIEVQLKKVLDSKAELTLYYNEAFDREELESYDIILTTYKLPYECSRPTIRIREVFNERELYHKIEKAKYWDQVDVPVIDNNWFVINGLLDESRFFLFQGDESYEEAVSMMADSLAEQGYVDDDFFLRLKEREKKGTMVFDKAIALPHTVHYAGDKLVMAIGVCETGVKHQDHDIPIIILLGFPEESGMDDQLLIRIYDEIITIAQDEALMKKIAKAKTFTDLLRVLYRQPGE